MTEQQYDDTCELIARSYNVHPVTLHVMFAVIALKSGIQTHQVACIATMLTNHCDSFGSSKMALNLWLPLCCGYFNYN